MVLSALDCSLGAVEIGTLCSVWLWGLSTMQIYVYYTLQHGDPFYVRTLVIVIWVLESMQTISLMHGLYRLTVTFYGDTAALSEGNWALNATAVLDGLIGALVQCFFAHRIYVLSQRWHITIVSWIFSFLALVGSIAVLIVAELSGSILGFRKKTEWVITATLVTVLFVDILNTVSLSIYLRVGTMGRSDDTHILNKSFLWLLETNLVTTSAGIIMLIFWQTRHNTDIWAAVAFFYAKLYSNSMMATLNSRRLVRDVSEEKAHGTFALSNIKGQNPGFTGTLTSELDGDYYLSSHRHGKAPPFAGSAYQFDDRSKEYLDLKEEAETRDGGRYFVAELEGTAPVRIEAV